MKIHSYIIFIIFFINIFNCIKYVNSGISNYIQASNGEIEIYEYLNNIYESHATVGGFTLCTFSNRYAFKSLPSTPTIILGDTSSTNSGFNQEVLYLNFTVAPSDKSQYIDVGVMSGSLYTLFNFNLTCKDISENKLSVKLINQRSKQLDNGISFFYISIKGLEYPIRNLVQYISIQNSSVQVISKEIYLVNFGYYNLGVLDENVLVVFKTKVFSLNLKATFNSANYQSFQESLYPVSINQASEPFYEYSKNIAPLVIFSTNLTNDPNYLVSVNNINQLMSVPTLIGQFESNGVPYNTYVMPLTNYNGGTVSSYSLLYSNGTNRALITYSIYYIEYQFTQIPFGNFISNQGDNIFKLEFNSVSFSYSNSPFKYIHYSYELVSEFPFGFLRNTIDGTFYYSAYFFTEIYSSTFGKFEIIEYPWGKTGTEYIGNTVTDFDPPPSIKSLEIIPIIGFTYLLKITISSAGFSKIVVSDRVNELEFGLEALSSGLHTLGSFEMVVSGISSIKSLKVVDIYGSISSFEEFDLVCNDINNVPVLLESPLQSVEMDIYNVTFFINDMDVLNRPCYNTIYFNSSSIPHDYHLQFRLLDPVSSSFSSLGGNFHQNPIPIRWSQELQLFYCDFIVPKNTIQGVIPYEIASPYLSIHSSMFSNVELKVSNSKFDNDGPMICLIENANSFGKIGWRITIVDQVNGFSNGYIKAVGSIDHSSFHFNFTSSNATLGSNLYNGTYEIIIDMQSSCIEQDYTIEYIYLEDTNKIFSKFSRFDKMIQPEKNPLRNYISDLLNGILKTSTALKCSTLLTDTSGPVISLMAYTQNTDVGSADRSFNVSFTVSDPDSAIMLSQNPKVYLLASNYQLAQGEAKMVTFNSENSIYYECSIQLPYSFAYPGGALLSIYGATNSQGLYSGYSVSDIRISPLYSYTSISILLGYESYYYNSNADIIVYGKLLSGTTLAQIQYSNGSIKKYTPNNIIGESVVFIKKDVNDVIIGPFKVTLFIGDSITTNTIIIDPIYFNISESHSIPTEESLETPSPPTTTTPAPTNKPQKCLGSPECGGKDHGYCVENQGCVCYSPWISNDCLSKVIIVPQPSINNSIPNVEIPVIDDVDSRNSNQIENVFYKSLISLVSLRELDIKNKEIEIHPFTIWLFDEINPTTSKYFTNISATDIDGNKQLVDITATIIWFENESSLQFAYQNLTMNPSSIKYTVEISNYPFKSKFNKLQLVMAASILSNNTKDTCSSREFGDTTSGDNSNYLQIQIENKSLYGRFIKRGIINNGSTIVALDNELLDSQMNSILNPNEIHSYIGITIPSFEINAIIDPDFSVLLNSNSANSICTDKSSKLSSSKIAGIVIGCFAFACIILASIIYSIYKTKQKKKFLKNMDRKLKNFN